MELQHEEPYMYSIAMAWLCCYLGFSILSSAHTPCTCTCIFVHPQCTTYMLTCTCRMPIIATKTCSVHILCPLVVEVDNMQIAFTLKCIFVINQN